MTKPASGTALDTGHALYTSLEAVWAMLEGTGTTSADSRGNSHDLTFSAIGGGHDPTWGTDGSGDAEIRFPGVGSGSSTKPLAMGTILPDLSNAGNTLDYSLAYRIKQTTLNTRGMFLAQKGATKDYLWLAGHVPELLVVSEGGTSSTDTTDVDFTVYHDYVLTYTHGSGFRHYQDGVLSAGSPFGAGAGWVHGLDTLGAGYNSSSDFSLVGAMSYMYVWLTRVLTITEAAALHTNPYAFFQTAAAFVPAQPQVIRQAVKRAATF